jgi:hypothetical protein
MRAVQVLGFVLVALALPLVAGVAVADPRLNAVTATDPRFNAVTATDPRFNVAPGTLTTAPPTGVPSPLPGSPERFERDRDRQHRHRPGHPVLVIPQTVFVTPNRCWQPGYWTYQFVPQYYTYSAWVAGQWSPDGRWVEGHYAPAQYSSGYYQPLWMEGYFTSCP